jgi:sugar lactone lactonase YvrE
MSPLSSRCVGAAVALTISLTCLSSADAETVFVNDFHRIQAFDTTERPATATLIIGDVELESAGPVTVGPDGNLYALDRAASANKGDILRFEPDGTFLDVFSPATGLKFAEKIAFGPGGDLYVADASGTPPGVYRFDGSSGAAEGLYTSGVDLSFPFGLVFDDEGRLYVSDTIAGSARVHRYDASGVFEETVLEDKTITPADLLNFPRGLCIGEDDALYVVDHFDEVVYRYDPELDTIAVYSAAVNDPQDCVFGADGTLYVNVFGPKGILPIAPPSGPTPATPGPVFATTLTGHLILTLSDVTLTTPTSSSTTTLEPTVLCGDANANGSVNAADALLVLRKAVGLGECPLERCDTDQGGTVNAADALRVLRKAVGVDITLTCPV